MKVYRFTYEGKGIYEALKGATWKDGTWKNILRDSKKFKLLPNPAKLYEYNKKCKSYFTEKGMKRFEIDCLPIMREYLDNDKIKKREYEIEDSDIKYQDTYQIVI